MLFQDFLDHTLIKIALYLINMKKRDIDIGEINDFEKEREDYWSKIITGDIELENGDIFNDTNFYNKKHLKFEPEIIKSVLLAMAISIDDEAFKKKCKDKYMLLACFNEDIEDVIKTKINNEEPYTNEELEGSKKRFGKIFEISFKNALGIKE